MERSGFSLKKVGHMNFSAANIIAGLVFGGIGFVAFRYGRKEMLIKPMVIGIALMVYPYFISHDVAVFVIGAVLCALLYFFRE